MRRTQAERRADTRDRLLEAAAALFAERGIDGVSVSTVADAAERTSGAVYAHFGSKSGMLVALLDQWKDATGEAVAAEFETAETPDERLEALWRNFVAPPSGAGAEWVLLEHELWLHACRNPGTGEVVAGRYAAARRLLANVVDGDGEDVTAEGVATLLIGLVIGLEMQRRLDPGAVSDELALAGLRALALSGRRAALAEAVPAGE